MLAVTVTQAQTCTARLLLFNWKAFVVHVFFFIATLCLTSRVTSTHTQIAKLTT